MHFVNCKALYESLFKEIMGKIFTLPQKGTKLLPDITGKS